MQRRLLLVVGDFCPPDHSVLFSKFRGQNRLSTKSAIVATSHRVFGRWLRSCFPLKR